MARLIVKSPHIKCNGSQGAAGYMKYIATRERVEILPDDRPPTRKQEQLITKLSRDFPGVKELLEFGDYTRHPTKANASGPHHPTPSPHGQHLPGQHSGCSNIRWAAH